MAHTYAVLADSVDHRGAMNDCLLCALQIDDPLSASAMHGCIGVWGALMVAFFAKPAYLLQQVGITEADVARKGDHRGLFYGGNGRLLACQCIGVYWRDSACVPTAGLTTCRVTSHEIPARRLARCCGMDGGAHDPFLFHHEENRDAAGFCLVRDTRSRQEQARWACLHHGLRDELLHWHSPRIL